MTPALAPFAALLVIGLGWGMTTPLVKIAVADGHGPLGIMMWQMLVTAALLGANLAVRGRGLPLGAATLRLYAVVAALGMVLPHFFSYTSLGFLPAGVVSIIVSMVPMFALPLALLGGMERFRPVRAAGLGLGACAMILLVGPEASLPGAGAAGFILLAALTPLCYALEGAYVAKRGAPDVGPTQTLLGGTLLALIVVVPAALVSGQAVAPFAEWGVPELAIIGSGAVSALAYSGYVALIRSAGAVFAAQVAYLVTGSGVVWAMMFLGERYSPWVWAALAMLFVGLFLVQPRPALPDVGSDTADRREKA